MTSTYRSFVAALAVAGVSGAGCATARDDLCGSHATSFDGMCKGHLHGVTLVDAGVNSVDPDALTPVPRWLVTAAGAGEWVLEITSDPPVRLTAMADRRRLASGAAPLVVRVCLGSGPCSADATRLGNGFDLVVMSAASAKSLGRVTLRWSRSAAAGAAAETVSAR